MFGTKHSKTNRIQKTVKYKRNEQISNWNMQMAKIGQTGTSSFCFYMFVPS